MSEHSEQNAPATQPETESRSSGRVKWFNNKQGYGFVTVGQGERKDEDVFVHHTALRTGEEQYRYLVQGEYVEFGWTQADSGDHAWQATDVTGMLGGKLMCETRNEARQASAGRGGEARGRGWSEDGETRQGRRGWTEDEGESSDRQPRPPHRIRGGGPREYGEDVEWKLVPVRRGAKPRNDRGGDRGGRQRVRSRQDDNA